MLYLKEISEGIENSNYSITTDTAQCILTIIEQHPYQKCEWFDKLNLHLVEQGFCAPKFYRDKDNRGLREHNGKGVVVAERVRGQAEKQPTVNHLHQIGSVTAHLHMCTQSFTARQPAYHTEEWRAEKLEKLKPKITEDLYQTLSDEHSYQQATPLKLPSGVIHGDLFRDNVFFSRGRLNAIIDYYYACNYFYLYDLAIIINDWCIGYEGYNRPLSQIVLSSYESKRQITDEEYNALPQLLRLAALRFSLSRLHDQHFAREGVVVSAHDPDPMLKVLNYSREATASTFGL